jgi:hypothetical protein
MREIGGEGQCLEGLSESRMYPLCPKVGKLALPILQNRVP